MVYTTVNGVFMFKPWITEEHGWLKRELSILLISVMALLTLWFCGQEQWGKSSQGFSDFQTSSEHAYGTWAVQLSLIALAQYEIEMLAHVNLKHTEDHL